MIELRVTTTLADDVRVVTVGGELDVYSVPKLAEVLTSSAGIVVLDLCDVSFMDSTGLRTLAADQQRRSSQGGRLLLACRPQGPISRLLELTEMAAVFELYSSTEEATAMLAADS